jgi:hypothetical protein
MPEPALVPSLSQPAQSRILFIIADGLGGLPREVGGPTELEAAATPHLDCLASDGVVGLCTPIAPGITPGSGAAHLALFGYDPLEHRVGRGVLDALGVGVDLAPGDIAIRANLCTLDAEGRVTIVAPDASRAPKARGWWSFFAIPFASTGWTCISRPFASTALRSGFAGPHSARQSATPIR